MYEIEKVLTKLEADLDETKIGSDEYKTILDAFVKLKQVDLEEDKFNFERGGKITEEDLEERKFKAEQRWNLIKTCAENGVKIVSVITGICLFSYNLHAEANGLRADSMFGKSVDRLINQK